MRRALLFAGILLVGVSMCGAYVILVQPELCKQVAEPALERGHRGYRFFALPSIWSFPHEGGFVCVPYGWHALGAIEERLGSVRFTEETTGVFLRTDAFASKQLFLKSGGYRVTLMYPVDTNNALADTYERIVSNAFTNMAQLYNDGEAPDSRQHTVLVTAGLGTSREERESYYPDPSAYVTYLILDPEHSRAEQLLIHAVSHLYNRERVAERPSLTERVPLPVYDWQEAEASWTELAFGLYDTYRNERFDYLMRVHTAVHTGNYALVRGTLFDNPRMFDAMLKTAITREQSSFLDEQYAHYILGPLLLAGIEGLLIQNGSEVHVADMLRRLHTESETDFSTMLAEHGGPESVERMKRWILGQDAVPQELIDAAAAYYGLVNESL